MNNELIDHIIEVQCLPDDCREALAEMLEIEDDNEFKEELNIFAGNCYRFEPNHPRYDRDRRKFPRLEQELAG